eukprot:02491.XXX_41326_41442_1 [CDS] Oithona nana genome sequencing.
MLCSKSFCLAKIDIVRFFLQVKNPRKNVQCFARKSEILL